MKEGALVRSVVRGLRVSVAMFLMGAVAYFTASPEWVLLAPAVSMVGKFLREQYGIPYMPV